MENRFDDFETDRPVQVNMTPLIDIMLVLLIIFMVTSSIALESGLDISIPKTKSTTKTQSHDAIIVSLDKNGNVSIQGKKIDFKDFEKSIKEVLLEKKSDYIVLEGDSNSQLGKVIEIMDIAKIAGAKKFAVAAEHVK